MRTSRNCLETQRRVFFPTHSTLNPTEIPKIRNQKSSRNGSGKARTPIGADARQPKPSRFRAAHLRFLPLRIPRADSYLSADLRGQKSEKRVKKLLGKRQEQQPPKKKLRNFSRSARLFLGSCRFEPRNGHFRRYSPKTEP
jgi:hypothetical protein